MSYSAYLFDLDGVLVDTLDWIRGAYRFTAERYGFDASDGALAELYGRPLDHCYRVLHGAYDPGPLIACHREFQAAHMELQRLFSGAVDLLVELRARGARTALVSSRSGASLRVTLDRFDLARHIDRVVWAEECRRHKPHPEPVWIALRDLDARPESALMVGDTPNDIECGRAAGVDTAGATYGFLGAQVGGARPTHLIADVRAVSRLGPSRKPQGESGSGSPPTEACDSGFGGAG